MSGVIQCLTGNRHRYLSTEVNYAIPGNTHAFWLQTTKINKGTKSYGERHLTESLGS